MKDFDAVKVFQLLDEMEACVERVKVMCSQMKEGWSKHNERD